jgi:hypothetical protein
MVIHPAEIVQPEPLLNCISELTIGKLYMLGMILKEYQHG